MKNLLVEDWGPIKFQILEGTGEGDLLRAVGEFGFCGKPTANGRIYPRHLIEREIKRLNSKMTSRGLFGELDHPTDGSTQLKRASHLITKMWIEADGRVMGEMEILDTPNGRILRSIVESGARTGVSSRGVGSVKKDRHGNFMVQEDFRLLTYDAVADPAWGDAIPEYKFEDEEVQSGAGMSEGNNSPHNLPENVVEEIRREERERVAAKYRQQFDEERRQLEAKVASGLEQMHHEAYAKAREQVQVESAGPEGDALSRIKEAVAPLISLDEEKEQLVERCLIKDSIIESLQSQFNALKVESALNEHAARVPDEHRGRFMALVGNPADFPLYEDFEHRLSMVVEEFESNGRYFTHQISQASALLSEAEQELAEKNDLLSEAFEGLLEMERSNLRRATLLEEAGREIYELRESVFVLEGECEGLVSDLEEAQELLSRTQAHAQRMVEQKEDELREEHEIALSELQEACDRAELELYKHKKVVGHASPATVLEHLQYASTQKEVDRMIVSMQETRRAVKPPVPVSSNGMEDPLDSDLLRERIEQVIKAKPSPQAKAAVHKLTEASVINQGLQGFESAGPAAAFEIPGFDPGQAKKLLESQKPFIPGG